MLNREGTQMMNAAFTMMQKSKSESNLKTSSDDEEEMAELQAQINRVTFATCTPARKLQKQKSAPSLATPCDNRTHSPPSRTSNIGAVFVEDEKATDSDTKEDDFKENDAKNEEKKEDDTNEDGTKDDTEDPLFVYRQMDAKQLKITFTPEFLRHFLGMHAVTVHGSHLQKTDASRADKVLMGLLLICVKAGAIGKGTSSMVVAQLDVFLQYLHADFYMFKLKKGEKVDWLVKIAKYHFADEFAA